MVFSSIFFLYAFFPLSMGMILITHLLFKNLKNINLLIVLVSIIFYFISNGAMVWLLIFSILLNWFLAKQLVLTSNPTNRRLLLISGVSINLGLLFYYKYTRFFLDSLSTIFDSQIYLEGFSPVLPVGISFFTFMSVSYLIDCYRQQQKVASLLEYSTYLTLFPHLVAGPIVRFSELANEIKKRTVGLDDLYIGGVRFARGLGKKILIADQLSKTVDPIFALPLNELTGGLVWLGAICYTFQIYFDFSGYTDMAIGLGRMLGFRFPENFNHPYRSTSIGQFWRRWHMSLSRWLRDYLYIPLGGNRKGLSRTMLNIFVVFFLCGLWHGAAWTFIAWGVFHGLLLMLERLASGFGFKPSGILGGLITFLLITLGWVLFRSVSFEQAYAFIQIMFTSTSGFDYYTIESGNIGRYLNPVIIVVLISSAILSFAPIHKLNYVFKQRYVRTGILLESTTACLLIVLASSSLAANTFSPFIYFRF